MFLPCYKAQYSVPLMGRPELLLCVSNFFLCLFYSVFFSLGWERETTGDVSACELRFSAKTTNVSNAVFTFWSFEISCFSPSVVSLPVVLGSDSLPTFQAYEFLLNQGVFFICRIHIDFQPRSTPESEDSCLNDPRQTVINRLSCKIFDYVIDLQVSQAGLCNSPVRFSGKNTQ